MAEDTVEHATPKKQVVALIKAANTAKTRVASINGEIGERLKHAKENANLHLPAFKLIAKLVDMDEEKRDEFLRAFDLYRDYAKEENLFGEEHVGDLVEDAEREAEADGEAEQVASNVTALRRGIKELSEDEQEFDDATSPKPSRRNRRPKGVEGGDAPGTYKTTH
jgi:hypothetical protein